MFRPGTDESNVQMSDVLCDFCHRPWAEDVALIEGHRGCMICGHCLEVGYLELVVHAAPGPAEYTCTMCREDDRDRAALDRAGEPGWASPAHPESVICSRCVQQASAALEKDPDHEWTRPAE